MSSGSKGVIGAFWEALTSLDGAVVSAYVSQPQNLAFLLICALAAWLIRKALDDLSPGAMAWLPAVLGGRRDDDDAKLIAALKAEQERELAAHPEGTAEADIVSSVAATDEEVVRAMLGPLFKNEESKGIREMIEMVRPLIHSFLHRNVAGAEQLMQIVGQLVHVSQPNPKFMGNVMVVCHLGIHEALAAVFRAPHPKGNTSPLTEWLLQNSLAIFANMCSVPIGRFLAARKGLLAAITQMVVTHPQLTSNWTAKFHLFRGLSALCSYNAEARAFVVASPGLCTWCVDVLLDSRAVAAVQYTPQEGREECPADVAVMFLYSLGGKEAFSLLQKEGRLQRCLVQLRKLSCASSAKSTPPRLQQMRRISRGLIRALSESWAADGGIDAPFGPQLKAPKEKLEEQLEVEENEAENEEEEEVKDDVFPQPPADAGHLERCTVLGSSQEDLTGTAKACSARRSGCTRRDGVEGVRLTKCSRCKNAFYCSKECQRIDWALGGHKEVCNQLVQQQKSEVKEEE